MAGLKTLKGALVGNMGLKILSLVLAVILWLWVIGEQKSELIYTAPLEVKNLSSDLVMLNDIMTESVQVVLRGSRTDLLSLSPKQVKLTLDLKNAREGERYYYLRPQDIETPRGIEVVSITPTRARVALEAVAEKELEVVPQVKGKPAKGYQVIRITSDPETVRVSGPRSIVNSLRRIDTLPVNINGAKDKVSQEVDFDPGDRNIKFKDYKQAVVSVIIVKKDETIK